MDAHEFIDRVMALWGDPVPPGPAGEAAFGACYAPSLVVNGTPFTLGDLVARARALQVAYSDIRAEVLDVVSTPDKIVVAFVMHVRHTGPLTTPLGVAAPTGREGAVRTIDILTVRDGRITGITVAADELGLLTSFGVLKLS
jgi:ketosteroid isomerase-like protein